MLQWGRNFIVAEMSSAYPHISGQGELQWSRNFIVAEISGSVTASLSIESLQWSRNFIVVEMPPVVKQQIKAAMASMEPQLYRCGNVAGSGSAVLSTSSFNGAATLSLRKFTARALSCTGIICFNGAATLSLRKYVGVFGKECGSAASMEPQLYRCGNPVPQCMQARLPDMLQWGRNFIVAETRNGSNYGCKEGVLQWGRNFIVAETRARAA